MKTIVIDPVTRIEGHAKISIHLDDDGQVTDTFFHVTQLRGSRNSSRAGRSMRCRRLPPASAEFARSAI